MRCVASTCTPTLVVSQVKLRSSTNADHWARVGGEGRNLLRLFFHPAGLRPLVANWDEVAPLLWERARKGGGGAQRPRDAVRARRAGAASGCAHLRGALDAPLVPVLPLTLILGEVRLSLFTVIATFGMAQDITADELRIESLFPADAATDALLRAAAGA